MHGLIVPADGEGVSDYLIRSSSDERYCSLDRECLGRIPSYCPEEWQTRHLAI